MCSEKQIEELFLSFLGKTSVSEYYVPWKEYPFYCPFCKKEQYFRYNDTLLVKKRNQSVISYICPVHHNYKVTGTFDHITDELIT